MSELAPSPSSVLGLIGRMPVVSPGADMRWREFITPVGCATALPIMGCLSSVARAAPFALLQPPWRHVIPERKRESR